MLNLVYDLEKYVGRNQVNLAGFLFQTWSEFAQLRCQAQLHVCFLQKVTDSCLSYDGFTNLFFYQILVIVLPFKNYDSSTSPSPQ